VNFRLNFYPQPVDNSRACQCWKSLSARPRARVFHRFIHTLWISGVWIRFSTGCPQVFPSFVHRRARCPQFVHRSRGILEVLHRVVHRRGGKLSTGLGISGVCPVGKVIHRGISCPQAGACGQLSSHP